MIQILHRYTREILYTSETAQTIAEAVIAATKAKANLGEANLHGADLRGANLRGADLRGANLGEAKNATLVIAHTRILPDGDLIGWKRCNAAVLVKLRIPADAKRSHAMGRKCRAEYADDLGHYTLSGDPLPDGHEAVTDTHGPRTVYRKGERITADSWDEDWMHECSHGIHFWITREEAAVWD